MLISERRSLRGWRTRSIHASRERSYRSSGPILPKESLGIDEDEHYEAEYEMGVGGADERGTARVRYSTDQPGYQTGSRLDTFEASYPVGRSRDLLHN